jgi:endonuclease G
VNEGIRVSRLVKKIRAGQYVPSQRALVDQLLSRTEAIVLPGIAQPPASGAQATPPVSRAEGLTGTGTVTVPLEVTVRVGNGTRSTAAADEAIRIDPDYSDRRGYDEGFLGTGKHSVPLATLDKDLIEAAAINTKATSEPRYVLPYHHFSIVQNKQRKLAFLTAVNIDGASSQRLKRERDHWSFDPHPRGRTDRDQDLRR